MIFDVAECEKVIAYNFKDKSLLRQCFTFSSYANENDGSKDNERLEYLGDSILGFIIADFLYRNYSVNEGDLTEMRKNLVSKEPLGNAIKKCGLDQFMLIGKGMKNELTGTEKLYSSLFESVVAGIYLDSGLNDAKKFIMSKLGLLQRRTPNDKKQNGAAKNQNNKNETATINKEETKRVIEKKIEQETPKTSDGQKNAQNKPKVNRFNGSMPQYIGKMQEEVAAPEKPQKPENTIKAIKNKDIKSKLQEYVQAKVKGGKVEYQDLDKKGPDHNPTFVVACVVNGETVAEGEGQSKKKAQTEAAEKAFAILNK